MLQFIFGKPASGKSYTVINKIKELTEKGKQAVLIVPEQFTFETERAVLKALGDSAALSVNVLSFSRLADEVGRAVGGMAATVLGESDKVIFMNKALKNAAPELKIWGKYVNSLSFAKSLLDTIGEFKINAITANEIKKTADKLQGSLALKLNDIYEIYYRFDELIGERFIDPSDILTQLYKKLEGFEFFKGKTVFLVSFKGFTGQQFKIIERIMAQAEDVYASFTYNNFNKTEYGLFSNIETSIEKIKKIADKYGVKQANALYLEKNFYNNGQLSALEALISENAYKEAEETGNITVCKAATGFDEAQFAARTIRRLVRTENYRYRDFVIIARQVEDYKEAVLAACKQNDIPLFFDDRLPLSAFPLAVAARSAIEALNLSTESILRFNKTGLGNLTTEEISKLENYTYIWNISGELWLKAWDMNPNGFIATEGLSEREIIELKEINSLREKAISPILEFKESFDGSAKSRAKSIIGLFKSVNASEKLINLSESFRKLNNNFTVDILKQSYSEYMKILDSLVICLGEAFISKQEFSDALNLAVATSSIGVIPQMLDEVTFGAADRIRPSRPKVAFILGVNQGIFPKQLASNGLLNNLERRTLIENELELADNSLYSSIEEEYLIYTNLCCASDKVYITYSMFSNSGDEKSPSTIVDTIIGALNPVLVCEPDKELTADNLPETTLSAIEEFCTRKITDLKGAVTLKEALKEDDSLKRIENSLTDNKNSIKPETAQRLFGKNMELSASRIDVFNRCRFSYFCQYGLRAKKLQPAQFDVMQKGTIVHYVMEKLITDYRDSLNTLTKEDLLRICEELVNEYLNRIEGYRSIENKELEFLVSRLLRSLKEVVLHVVEEIKQSDFKPVACELKIGKEGDIESPVFPYDNGEITINGSVDRVDSFNGYIRIIDYKTGNKSFKLPDVLFGLNLQMLIYLYAIIRGMGLSYENAAGILYQPSKRCIKEGDTLAMNGLLPLDIALVNAMDKSGEGAFVPKININKNGSFAKRNESFIEQESFSEIFDFIELSMAKLGNSISNGDISISPLDGRESEACKYCNFKDVCSIEDSEIPQVPSMKNEEIIEAIKESKVNGI